MLKSDFHVAEMIRREDAAALRRRKKKAITVEIDPETYIAKEILYQQAVLYAIRQEIGALRSELCRLHETILKER